MLATVVMAAMLGQAMIPSRPRDLIGDEAELLSSNERSELVDHIEGLRERTGVQVAVLTSDESGREAPSAIAVRALRLWNLPARSVVTVVLMDQRQIWIQPGSALATTFDAGTSSTIAREVMAPQLREGRSAQALLRGVDAIARRLGGGAVVVEAGPRSIQVVPQSFRHAETHSSSSSGLLCLLFMLCPPLALLIVWLRNRRRARAGYPGGFFDQGWPVDSSSSVTRFPTVSDFSSSGGGSSFDGGGGGSGFDGGGGGSAF